MINLHTALVIAGCLGLACSPAMAQESKSAEGLTLDQARMMDADRNGRITVEEFLQGSSDRNLFAELDTNFDGALDIEEQRQGIRIPIRTMR